jgi:hypothetical protein
MAGVNGRKPHSCNCLASPTFFPTRHHQRLSTAHFRFDVRATASRQVLLFVLGAACARPSSPLTDKARLEVQWNGSTGGRIGGAAVAGWCAERRVLQISLVQGDTGLALALYPDRALRDGVYPVVDPIRAESMAPAAGVAVRWLTRTTVQGFQGDSGRVSLERGATGRLSGQVHARARSVVDTQRIRLSGTFRDLIVVQDTLGCDPADTTDEDAGFEDTGVD